jgi:hypothetical protein
MDVKEKKALDTKFQYLVNEICNVAPATRSEFPMKAYHAKVRLVTLREELSEKISELLEKLQ